MANRDIDDFTKMLHRLESALSGLRAWSEKSTWKDANRILDQLPLKVLSLEDRSDKTKRLFLRKDVVVEEQQSPSFADLVGSSEWAKLAFVAYLPKLCNRTLKAERAMLAMKLVSDARYHEIDVDSEEFKRNVDRQTSAIVKPSSLEMLRRIYSDRTNPGIPKPEYIDSKISMQLKSIVGYEYGVSLSETQEAITRIVRKLVVAKRFPLSLEELGIESEPHNTPSTIRVTTSKPVLNTTVSQEVMSKIRKEIERIQSELEFLEDDQPDSDERFTVLPFEIFPAGEWSVEQIVRKFEKSGVVLTQNHILRLKTIKETFRPDRIAIGRLDSRGYRGYFVFIFDKQDKVIAENPLYGNATYVVKGEWNRILNILKLTKKEVRQHPHAKFVIHRNKTQWLQELRQKFSRD